MTNDKLDEITTKVIDTVRNGGDLIWNHNEYKTASLIDLVVSLHNELYKEVTGEYYDYMFHWANLGYGGDPDDGLFKEGVE